MGNDLPRNARNVTHYNKGQKQNALPFCGFCTQGFYNVHRPGKPKANHHNHFQNIRHNKLLFSPFFVFSIIAQRIEKNNKKSKNLKKRNRTKAEKKLTSPALHSKSFLQSLLTNALKNAIINKRL